MKAVDAFLRIFPPALIVQFFKFGLVGVVGFGVDYGVLKFCILFLGLNDYVGRIISFFLAATVTWVCNRAFTFRGKSQGRAHVQWAKFVTVSIGGFALNFGTYAILIGVMPFFREYLILAVAAGSIAGMFFNFFAARRIVFG